MLDMFAGSGALGIEAASRGADRVILCEENRRAAGIIRENLRRVGNPENIVLLSMPYQKALVRLKDSEMFNIVFLDPPYHADAYAPALRGLAEAGVLVADSLLILESDAQLELDLPNFETERIKKYGNTFITWERRKL